jgi:stringent starvation protein B
VYSNLAQFAYLYANIIESLAPASPTDSTTIKLNVYASALANLELFKDGIQSSEAGKNLNVSSGFLWGYDGYQATENNFFVYPDSTFVGANTSSSGDMVDDTYFYRVTYEWTDNQGNLIRSTPSIPFNLQIYAGSSVTGNTANSSPIITNVSSTAALQPGQKYQAWAFLRVLISLVLIVLLKSQLAHLQRQMGSRLI